MKHRDPQINSAKEFMIFLTAMAAGGVLVGTVGGLLAVVIVRTFFA